MLTTWAAKNFKKRLSISTNGIYMFTNRVNMLFFRLTFLEESKFDHEENHERQKYDVKSLRLRVNDLMGKDNKKKVNIRK